MTIERTDNRSPSLGIVLGEVQRLALLILVILVLMLLDTLGFAIVPLLVKELARQ